MQTHLSFISMLFIIFWRIMWFFIFFTFTFRFFSFTWFLMFSWFMWMFTFIFFWLRSSMSTMISSFVMMSMISISWIFTFVITSTFASCFMVFSSSFFLYIQTTFDSVHIYFCKQFSSSFSASKSVSIVSLFAIFVNWIWTITLIIISSIWQFFCAKINTFSIFFWAIYCIMSFFIA